MSLSRLGLAALIAGSAAISALPAFAGQATYRPLVERVAAEHGVPSSLAHAVVTIESRYNPRATGRNVYGLMQLKHPTARSMGYSGGIDGLYDAETNVRYGMKYLARAYRLSNGDVCGTIMRYTGGLRATRISSSSQNYCNRAQAIMARDPGLPASASAYAAAGEPQGRPERAARASATSGNPFQAILSALPRPRDEALKAAPTQQAAPAPQQAAPQQAVQAPQTDNAQAANTQTDNAQADDAPTGAVAAPRTNVALALPRRKPGAPEPVAAPPARAAAPAAANGNWRVNGSDIWSN